MSRMYTLCLAGIVGLGLGATGCGGGGGGYSGGSFDVAWDFGAGVYCADVGVTEVELDVLDLRTNHDYYCTFPCSAFEGTSPLWPDDDYTVALSAYASASAQTPLSTTDFNGAVYSIYAGVSTPLPEVTFLLHH
jgi:hypothetical protein